MEFYTLASSSAGNAALVCHNDTHLLIDAGISCRRITQSLAVLDLTLDDLDGILITHEHIDHVRGLVTLAKKCPAPLYATFGTAAAIQYPEPRLRAFAAGKEFTIKDLHIRSFRTSHDAKESVGYRIESDAGSLAVLTDTGFVTDEAHDAALGADMLLLESNHDVVMLKNGGYPYYLKQRILSLLSQAAHPERVRAPVERRRGGIRHRMCPRGHERHSARALERREQLSPACRIHRRPRPAIERTERPPCRRAARHHQRGTRMQKITVLCVGKLKEAFYEQAVKEYEKRLSRCCKLELLELPEQRLGDEPSEAEIRQALKKEAALVEQKLSKGGALIAMCIEGQEMSSVALSQKMQQLAARGASQLTFLIGSSFGLDEDLKKKADLRLSMSPMTFPHHLARVMLLEQIYRAYQIEAGTKYHK